LEDTDKRENLAMGLTFRQKLLSILALVYEKSQKEIGAKAGMPPHKVSQQLSRERQGEMKDEVYERLLAGIEPFPAAAVPIVKACLEALDALEKGDLTEPERAEREEEVLAAAATFREALDEALRLSREGSTEGYPEAHDLEPARARAEELFGWLRKRSADERLEVVRAVEELQTWALCERVCAASVRAASRDLDAAAGWAHLAVEMAERVRAPEGFRRRLRGYAAAHAANVLRVKGDLEAADAEFEQAKRLWLSGSDPDGVLDPGRLLDLEASLRRSQRRLGEALARLEEAEAVGRCRERILVKKGFTLEVMGDYEGAVAALLEAEPLAERAGDPRLLYMARFNLAVVLTHLGRYGEAAELARHVRDLATARGDGNEVPRVTWLEGRIAAGLGRTHEALRLLAEARQEFERRKMFYDVALALLEEAVLLLEEGRTSEVQALAEELTKVFAANGVHREALAALRLFHEAAEREEATAELARRVLRFLFRARHDPELRFEEPER